jgi:hypothetical protein
MDIDDCDLTSDQWDALRMLRLPAAQRRSMNRRTVENLVALQLAAFDDGRPAISAKGRSVLLRGSPQLLDLAA